MSIFRISFFRRVDYVYKGDSGLPAERGGYAKTHPACTILPETFCQGTFFYQLTCLRHVPRLTALFTITTLLDMTKCILKNFLGRVYLSSLLNFVLIYDAVIIACEELTTISPF